MYKGKYGTYWIDDNILHVRYKKQTIIDLKIAKKIVSDRLLFQQNREFPVFCDISGVIGSTSLARYYLANEGSTLISAVGIYGIYPISISLTQFYLKHLKHTKPTAFFTNKFQTLNFLKPYTLDM